MHDPETNFSRCLLQACTPYSTIAHAAVMAVPINPNAETTDLTSALIQSAPLLTCSPRVELTQKPCWMWRQKRMPRSH
jgi:hypothetical protein